MEAEMYVSSTLFQNNFGKYLDLCERENVIITKNGKKRAMLLHYPRNHDGFEAGEPIAGYGTSPPPKPEGWVSYREFQELTEKSEKQYELIDGVVYLMASPGFTHQQVLGRLYVLFHDFFRDREGCDPFLSPFDVDLVRDSIRRKRETTEDDINVVQPDLVVLCDYEKDINEKDRYKGTPALVVEILSPSTRSKDKIKKMDLYMDGGIGEFWVVDPEKKSIGVFTFEDYDLAGDADFAAGEKAASGLFPGLEVEVGALFGA
jgi:Uma2 family endonuclease